MPSRMPANSVIVYLYAQAFDEVFSEINKSLKTVLKVLCNVTVIRLTTILGFECFECVRVLTVGKG